jgi:hypothetical protein
VQSLFNNQKTLIIANTNEKRKSSRSSIFFLVLAKPNVMQIFEFRVVLERRREEQQLKLKRKRIKLEGKIV